LFAVLPLAIILLAAILRFHMIDHQSLWNDEGNTLRLVERSIPALLDAASHDIHPPGYYLALKGWWTLTGESEFALRAFSAFMGILTVACVYALGRALFAPGVAVLASGLVALNAFSVYYSQEARMYAMLALVAAAAMLVFIRWTARPSWWLAFALALLNAIGLFMQYTYPFILIAQGILFLLWWIGRRDRRTLAMYSVSNVLMLILFAPQFGTALTQLRQWPRTGYDVDAGTGVATVAQWLVYGNTSPPLGWTAYVWPALFAIAALLPDWWRARQPSWWRRAVPWLWLLLTVGPLFAFGLFRTANLKFLLPAEIAVALLIARGIWLLWEIGSPNLFILREAWPRLLAAAGLFSVFNYTTDTLNNLYTNSTFFRSDYRAMVQLISAAPRSGDAIILDAPNQSEVFTYYYHGSTPIFPLPEGLGGDDPKTITALNQIISDHQRIFVLYWGESERDPNRVVEKTLKDHAFEATSAWYGDVRLVQYATMPQSASVHTGVTAKFGDTITLQSAELSATSVAPGDVLGITLTWTTSQPISKRYKVFVQLLDKEGKLVAQHDSEPGNNLAITTTWEVYKPIHDSHGILIPGNTVPGEYTLILGLYDLNDPMVRLSSGTEDQVGLSQITVVH
jgi:uncharacterized membrane protein